MKIGKEVIPIKKLSWHQKLLVKKELKIKVQLFRQLGYVSVNEMDLLNYVVLYRWRRKMPQSIKACKKDILAIKPNDYFDYQQLKAQTSFLELKDWHDLEDLF